MSNYHCYRPVGSVAVLTKRCDGGAAPAGTPVLVVVTDHNDGDLYYGVSSVLHPRKRLFTRRITTNPTVLHGYEEVKYFYVRGTTLDFCDSVTSKENDND